MSWLLEQCRDAAKNIEAWPKWMKLEGDQLLRDARTVDPCKSPRRCDEAQTCVGSCRFTQHRPTNLRIVPKNRFP